MLALVTPRRGASRSRAPALDHACRGDGRQFGSQPGASRAAAVGLAQGELTPTRGPRVQAQPTCQNDHQSDFGGRLWVGNDKVPSFNRRR